MKKLYLLRHAQAESGYSIKDHDRSLTDYGIAQSGSVGEHLKNIDLALCSSAVRTKMTLEHAFENRTPPKKIEFSDYLYNASPETLLDQAHNADEAGDLLIVAHNPGIHMFAHDLVLKDMQSPASENLSMTYPPCTLTILECPIISWKELSLQKNKLIDYIQVNLDRAA